MSHIPDTTGGGHCADDGQADYVSSESFITREEVRARRARPEQPEVDPNLPPENVAENAIDAGSVKDQASIRSAIRRWPKRWKGIDEAKKQKWLEQLEVAGDSVQELLSSHDPGMRMEAAKVVVSVVKTATAMEGQNQADEHLAVRMANPEQLNVNVNETRRVVIDVAGLGDEAQRTLGFLSSGPVKKLPPTP